jgi:hypothetical protein
MRAHGFLALCVVVLVASAAFVAAEKKLIQVQVMHRHGAREAICSYNTDIVCNGPNRCGELNSEGKDMLVKLGQYLRQQYAQPLKIPQNYSQYVAFSRSTDLNRTIQSADGMLRGLFNNSADFFPVVNTVDFNTDLLLLVDAQMSYHLPAIMNMAPGFNLPQRFFDTFSASQLNTMGVETLQQPICNLTTFTQLEFMACALRVQDIAASWNASGQLDPKSTTGQAFNNGSLNGLRQQFNAQLYVYDPSNAVMKARGNLGFNLASTIGSMMQGAAGLTARQSTFPLFHWSAHDTTYMPLASAIGMNNATYMLPGFGQAFIFELWQESTDNSTYVRIYNGAPTQYPGEHAYAFEELTAQGLDSNGNVVTGLGATNPLALQPFLNLINSGKAQSTAGMCYVTPDVINAIGCSQVGAPQNPNCLQFRQSCPAYACAANSVLNSGDLTCLSLAQPEEVMSTSSAATMCTVTAVAGLVLGAALNQIGNIVYRKYRPYGRDAEGDYLVASSE